MRRVQPINVCATMDLLTRYFLRRYAQARRNPRNATPSVPYREATLETSFLFIAMPFIALYSVALITSLRWPLISRAAYDQFAVRPLAVIIFLAVLVVGHVLLIRRFNKYRLNPAICAEFDSERDREIIFWQKTVGFVVAAIVVPLVTLVITFWPAISGV